MVLVAVELVERDRFGAVHAATLLPMRPDSPAQLAAVPRDLLGDRIEQGGCGCGAQGLVRSPGAQVVVPQAQQFAQCGEQRLATVVFRPDGLILPVWLTLE